MTKREQEQLTRKVQRDIFADQATVEGPMFESVQEFRLPKPCTYCDGPVICESLDEWEQVMMLLDSDESTQIACLRCQQPPDPF